MAFYEELIQTARINGGKILRRIGLTGQSDAPRASGRVVDKSWSKNYRNPNSEGSHNSQGGASNNSEYVQFNTVLKTIVGAGAVTGAYIKVKDFQADVALRAHEEEKRKNLATESENTRHHKQREKDNRQHQAIVQKSLDQRNLSLLEANRLKEVENQLKEQDLQQRKYLAERTWSQFIFGRKKE